MATGSAARTGSAPRTGSVPRSNPTPRGGPAPRRGSLTLYLIVGILVSAIFVVPLAWEVIRSFQPSLAISSQPSAKAFQHLTTQNYTDLLAGKDDIVRNIVNSAIVAVLTSLLTAVVATLAGYGFGRFRFRGAGTAFGLILLGLMIPFQAVLTPLFLELHFLHMLNSLIGLSLFYTAFNLPFGVYVMRNSFLAVPKEIINAARVDGASTMRMLVSVLRPLILPGVATTTLYAFLFSWTEFLGALTLMTNDGLFTLPVALSNVETGTYGSVNYGLLIAGAVISMVPCIAVYVSLQRYYVRGLVSGALKG
jgi:multiple sugar transport system permease protein